MASSPSLRKLVLCAAAGALSTLGQAPPPAAPPPATSPPATPQAAPRPGGPSGGLSPYSGKLVEVTVPNPLTKYTPVTEFMLSNPAPGDWLTWRRAYDYQGFSPLKQVDRANVRNLRAAWS
jgi:hypothetical protein